MLNDKHDRSPRNHIAIRLRWFWNETKRAGREYHFRLLEGFRSL